MTYAALPGNGLPIQRNYGIARRNEKHQPVSRNTSCLHIHLPLFSISNFDPDFHSNFDADSNVADTDADGAFWAGWLRRRSGVRILSRGELPLKLLLLYSIRLLLLQPLLLLLQGKLPTIVERKAAPLSYSLTVIERVLTSTREHFSKNTRSSDQVKKFLSRWFWFPRFLTSFPFLER